MAIKSDHSKLALVVQLEDNYGQLKLVARVFEQQENGEFLNREYRYGSGQGRQYDGFLVSAYVDYNGLGSGELDQRGVWGQSYRFEPASIDSAEHATAIATVMRRLASGLEKLNNTDGYLRDADFAMYLLRIAKVLGIPKIYVHNRKRSIAMSGERFRSVDGAGLQSYVSMVVSDVHAGRRNEYIGR